jgi:hypothetical protein
MELITLKEARLMFWCRPTLNTVRIWTNAGLSTFDAKGRPARLYLQVHREGGRVYTTKEWVKEFQVRTSVPLRKRPKHLRK